MLITQEFEREETLRSSSGEIVGKLGSNTFVAVYELGDGDVFDLQHYLAETEAGHSVDKDVLIFSKTMWDSLHDMLLRNYDMKAKL